MGYVYLLVGAAGESWCRVTWVVGSYARAREASKQAKIANKFMKTLQERVVLGEFKYSSDEFIREIRRHPVDKKALLDWSGTTYSVLKVPHESEKQGI